MEIFKKLKIFIEQDNTRGGKYFDIFIQMLIIISIVSFSIETLPDISQDLKDILLYIEIVSVIIFTIEYLLRLLVSNSKSKFVFSFYGLIDLFAILPFYIASGIDLRSIRIFRLFRLLRMFKLFRYSHALVRYKNAFILIKTELTLFLSATLFLFYVSSVGIYYFENSAQPEQFSSVFHSMWWAVATLTTIGYGDMYPITLGGRIFTAIIVIIGLGIVAVPTGLFASALTQCIELENKKK